MANSGEPSAGGEGVRDTQAATGPGLPDEAVGPEGRTFRETTELADSAEGRRIEQKLRAEALARRAFDDDAAVDDPTGHA